MPGRTCIVAGASGVAGRAFIEELEERSEWEIIALARRKLDFVTRAHFVPVDLLDAESCDNARTEFRHATHIFFGAYAPRPHTADETVANLMMLTNLVRSVDGASSRLQHVALIQGSKWYGNHLGPYKTPAREDDPRGHTSHFYYDQQDWLEQYQQGRQWTWSSWRPHGLCGLSVNSSMNQLNALAVYATISRELGLPLCFPGKAGAFRAIYQFTDARLLGRAVLWADERPGCANKAFNITNGDYDRWENLWPEIARAFALEAGPVRTLSLTEFMADKEPLWARIRERYQLRPYKLRELVNWEFADWVYSNAFDQMSSLARIRQAGWAEALEPRRMFHGLFAKMRAQGFIPRL